MTYSIVAYDPIKKQWGVAVQSKFVAVGSLVPFARANIGAIATQAYVNTSYGPKGLELLQQGMTAQEVINKLISEDPNSSQRQVGIVDSFGNAASFTGKDCYDWAGHHIGKNYSCQGNILASENVIKDMSNAFENANGDLIEKLFEALEAADAAGGDKRGRESAAILIVQEKGAYDGGTDNYIDIRVDEHPDPIKELHKVFLIYDLCILNRDDPKDILKIENEVLSIIVDELIESGFYSGERVDKYTTNIQSAFTKWLHTNNFEVKERKDDYIFGSVYRYIKQLREEK
ncbi:MAG: DUF1028 domain-containing protein [Candidatus Thorarchaeota archaeon]